MHKHDKLTQREHDVMSLVMSGYSNRQISNSLQLSVYTVETHLKNVYSKLGTRNRAEAVCRYMQIYQQD